MRLFSFFVLFTLSLGANERIVSLSPSLTEIVYALQSGEDLVATSEYSLYPNEAQKLPTIGGVSHPDIEKILSHRPSLVLGQGFNQTLLADLEHFGIKTLMLDLQRLSSIQNSLTLLGKKLGKEKKAQELVAQIDEALAVAPKATKAKKVLIVFGLNEDLSRGIYIAGHDIFFEDIITQCGHKNAYTATLTNQPVLSYENLIALNPDTIIILHSKASNPNVNKQKALEAWHKIPTNAAKNKNITVLEESYLHIPSHRVALTIEQLCEVMAR